MPPTTKVQAQGEVAASRRDAGIPPTRLTNAPGNHFQLGLWSRPSRSGVRSWVSRRRRSDGHGWAPGSRSVRSSGSKARSFERPGAVSLGMISALLASRILRLPARTRIGRATHEILLAAGAGRFERDLERPVRRRGSISGCSRAVDGSDPPGAGGPPGSPGGGSVDSLSKARPRSLTSDPGPLGLRRWREPWQRGQAGAVG
jgi:hypothetical protein